MERNARATVSAIPTEIRVRIRDRCHSALQVELDGNDAAEDDVLAALGALADFARCASHRWASPLSVLHRACIINLCNSSPELHTRNMIRSETLSGSTHRSLYEPEPSLD